MKILHIIIGLNVGGAEMMLKRLVESHHGNRAYRHIVVSLTDMGKLGEQIQSKGVEVYSLGMRSVFGTPLVLWRLVHLIRKSRPDIVQTWMYHADLLGGLAARLAGNRHVIWGIRTTEVQAGGSRVTVVVRHICALLSRWVPHTIVCAANAACRVHVAVGYDATRMVVIPNGFDFTRLLVMDGERAALWAQCKFNADDMVIGSLGRFNPVKDQQNFVRAAGLIAQRNPHVRFLMVGRDLDANNAELVRWIADTGYANRFVLLGERADVPICLAAMDVYCLHSRTEGFPNTVGEAMAMGVPCVVTDVGDAAILVADTGIVVPKDDSVALAQGLEQILAMTSEARKQMGQRAKARVNAEFTIERARKRFEAIYEKVLNG